MKINEDSTFVLKRVLCEQKRSNIFYDIAEKIKDNETVKLDIVMAYGLNILIHRYRDKTPRSIVQSIRKKFYFKKYKDALEYRNNIFFSEETKLQWMTTFSHVQKLYMALNRFAYIWKIKHSEVISTTDLYLNDIDSSKCHVLQIYQNKKLFYFTAKDFMSIIQHALCQCNNYFDIESKLPCNPYNKVKFSSCHMYNAYFQMRYKMHITISEIMEKWFRVGFCFHSMHNYHYSLLQKYAIKSFIWGSTETIRLNYISNIHTMFKEFCPLKNKIHIHRDFPKDVLVEKTRHYMYLFYLLKYGSLDDGIHDSYTTILTKALREFSNTHWNFGRLMYKKKGPNTAFPPSSFTWKPKSETETNTPKETNADPLSRLEYSFNTDVPNFTSRHL